ncbi:hypothetical protein [Actinosynnema pretiosum]|uniref:Phosphatidic acid phosphatase type 2/haloperoxidase domain-containing protein n=1 Tax=Actinosynnema pretiosum TaxID=42197 RepID=A0A290Z7S0_9PSEU|nr:hypothetical protein [Actinosynnema pretiosum]ATE55077.1 hypothetical protein CNX65_18770 [Actinosynnema pretiosum]
MQPASPTPPRRFAKLVTEVLAPWVWVVWLPAAIGWSATGTAFGALVWGAVVAVFGAVIPMAVIVHGARRGRWDNHHVTRREDRLVPLLTCVGSVGVGIAALALAGAPHEMIALAAAMFSTLVVTTAITLAPGGRGWKISVHSGVAFGAIAILAIQSGPWWALLWSASALVAWSRVELGDHTTGQVCGGAVLGVLGGGGIYSAGLLLLG